MKKCFLFTLLFSLCINALGQENKGKIVDIVMHRVELGETIVMISKKYLVNPTTIYNSNKFIIDGVNEGMMLQIPVVRKPGQEYATVQYQQPNLDGIPTSAIAVIEKKPKQALIADDENEKEDQIKVTKNDTSLVSAQTLKKEDSVAVADSYDPNLEAKKGAITKIEKDEEVLDDNYIIQPRETLYSISKKYNIPMDVIMAQNEEILKNGIVAGLKIKLPGVKREDLLANAPPKVDGNEVKPIKETLVAVETSNLNTNALPLTEFVPVADVIVEGILNHTVSPKETLYSLAISFNVSVEQLVAFNKDIEKNGLKVGDVIKVPTVKNGVIVPATNSDLKPVEDTKIDGIINHTVSTKETLFSLSKKFNVTVEDLTAFNADLLKNGLTIGSIIKIPEPGTIITKQVDEKPIATLVPKDANTHTVTTNETMYSIAKKYNTTIEELHALNESTLKNGIAIGTVIRIPSSEIVKKSNETIKVADVISNGIITHTIATGETLYNLSKTYNVTVEQINALNEDIEKNGFSIGKRIKLPVVEKGAVLDSNGIIATLDKKIAEFVMPIRTTENNEIIHKVISGETLFSISKKYSVTVYEIRSLNENILKSGLQIGQNIKIPVIKKEIPPKVNDNGIVEQVPGVVPTIKTDQGDALVEEYIVGDIIMTVQKEETLESIAAKYDVTPEEIIRNNYGVIKDKKVNPGQVIKVPASKTNSIQFSPETFD